MKIANLKRLILKQKDSVLFLYHFFRSPATMGSAFPSSTRLANYMAEQVRLSANGMVVELGPGTGVVTAALLKQGVPPDRLIVVEQSAAFANHLRKIFPHIRVIEGDATNLTELITPFLKIDAIVSSLPLRSLPGEVVNKILYQVGDLLDDKGYFIQFTYNLDKKNIKTMQQLDLYSSHIIWFNIPPACVHVFVKKGVNNHVA